MGVPLPSRRPRFQASAARRVRFVAIVGRSGSGKTTLLNLIAGIDRPTSGTVRVAGAELGSLSESELAGWRGENVGLVFQFFQLLPTLTVIENVMLPMDFAKKIPIGERRARARQLLERVGVADQADKVPATLSGDEVEVGRLAAITLQFAVGPETRELIERLAGRVAVQVELGPKTREVIEEFIPKRESEPRAAGVQPAR